MIFLNGLNTLNKFQTSPTISTVDSNTGLKEGRMEMLLNLTVQEGHAPLNSGLIFQTARGPRLENWPRESSMKKMGIPHIANMMK